MFLIFRGFEDFQRTQARKRFVECFVPRYLIPYEDTFNFRPLETPTFNSLATCTSDLLAPPTMVLETLSSFATPRLDLETMDSHAPSTIVLERMNSRAPPTMDLETMDLHAPPTTDLETMDSLAPPSMDLETMDSHSPPSMYLDAATSPYPKKRRRTKKLNKEAATWFWKRVIDEANDNKAIGLTEFIEQVKDNITKRKSQGFTKKEDVNFIRPTFRESRINQGIQSHFITYCSNWKYRGSHKAYQIETFGSGLGIQRSTLYTLDQEINS